MQQFQEIPSIEIPYGKPKATAKSTDEEEKRNAKAENMFIRTYRRGNLPSFMFRNMRNLCNLLNVLQKFAVNMSKLRGEYQILAAKAKRNELDHLMSNLTPVVS